MHPLCSVEGILRSSALPQAEHRTQGLVATHPKFIVELEAARLSKVNVQAQSLQTTPCRVLAKRHSRRKRPEGRCPKNRHEGAVVDGHVHVSRAQVDAESHDVSVLKGRVQGQGAGGAGVEGRVAATCVAAAVGIAHANGPAAWRAKKGGGVKKGEGGLTF